MSTYLLRVDSVLELPHLPDDEEYEGQAAASAASLLDFNPWPERREAIRELLPPNVEIIPIEPDGNCFMNCLSQGLDKYDHKEVRSLLTNELCLRAFGFKSLRVCSCVETSYDSGFAKLSG